MQKGYADQIEIVRNKWTTFGGTPLSPFTRLEWKLPFHFAQNFHWFLLLGESARTYINFSRHHDLLQVFHPYGKSFSRLKRKIFAILKREFSLNWKRPSYLQGKRNCFGELRVRVIGGKITWKQIQGKRLLGSIYREVWEILGREIDIPLKWKHCTRNWNKTIKKHLCFVNN